MPLRYYQGDACDCACLALDEFNRVLLTLGTGAGKTVCAAELIRRFQPHRCLFLADQDELCQQPLDAISNFAGIIAGLDKAKHRASLNSRVIVASAQTLAREERLYRYPRKFFKYGIVDEAHRGTERDQKITEHLCENVVGITATPFFSDLRDLSEYYEEIAYSMPMLDLIAEGFAPELKVMTLPIQIDLSAAQVKKSFGESEYSAESISTTIAPYYEEAAQLIKEHATGMHPIVFLPLVESSKAFAAIARGVGISAMHVDGKSKDRKEIIEGFKRGKFQMLCNANVAEAGVDIPIADCFVNMRPTRSAVKYQQSVGRVMRVLPGVIDHIPGRHQAAERRAAIAASAKPHSLIIDFLWQHDKLGIMRAGNLIARNDQEALGLAEKIKTQRTPEQLAAIAKMFQAEREALLVKQIEAVADRGSSVKPAMLGYLIGAREIMDYEPVSKWEAEPPSEKQLSLLQSYGVDAAAVRFKGEASKLLNEISFRKRFRLATPAKLQALQSAGINFDPRKLTDAEALRIITERKLGAHAA